MSKIPEGGAYNEYLSGLDLQEIYGSTLREEAESQRLCPKCDTVLNCEEVDIGVGTQRGNFRCDQCGWNETDEISRLFQKEDK